MLRILALALWFAPAAFLASPLTADDVYGAPDPGWYNAGSGWSRESTGDQSFAAPGYGRDYGSRGYGYDGPYWDSGGDRGFASGYPEAGRRDYQGYSSEYGYDTEAAGPDRYRHGVPDSARDTWSRRAAPDAVSPDGYGAPDWARQPLPQRRDWSDPPRRPDLDYGYPPGDAWSAVPNGYAEQRGPWRDPPSRPRYRFRDDPSLERPVGDAGYRFRPLTRREHERQHRTAGEDAYFTDDHRSRRYRPRNDDDRGTAFGYEPAPAPPDDFYRRYYQSGP
jgi:hypothetical protein